MKLTDDQLTTILASLREIEKCLKALPYQSKLVTRASTAEHCTEQVWAIRKELSGE